MTTKTIAAIATANANAGIGIIRLSGAMAKPIAQKVVRRDLKPRYATLCDFFDASNQIIDKGIAIYFKAPNSFTGEDIVELHCHGGVFLCQLLLDTLIEQGADAAQAGEFSKRAFLNNKLRLSEAEAIADLINANSKQEIIAINRSLNGEFANKIDCLTKQLIAIRVLIEASLDFPEEDIDFITDNNISSKLKSILDSLEQLLLDVDNGIEISRNLQLALVGAPNAGKSSIFNRLLKVNRSIVTKSAGTTRDTITSNLKINNKIISIADTAGVRATDDDIESISIERTKQEIDRVDCLLIVINADNYQSEKQEMLAMVADKNYKLIVNKIDSNPSIKNKINADVLLSAKTGEGFADLLELLDKLTTNSSQGFSARARHKQCLIQSRTYIKKALELLRLNINIDIIAEELTQAAKTLGQINGEVSKDELLGKIFSEFCIGK